VVEHRLGNRKCWWCYPTHFEEWEEEEFIGNQTIGPRLKVWNRGSKMEIETKMARRRGSDAG